ncbi:hypothetical protein AeRB84_012433 [Aphanomyces euteiches]|nr:hypothetical protein AeRB84_012433 [Aphanomyces euteiches]
MAPIESPRQGQIKRGSPIHSPTNASQQQQKGSFKEDPLLSVSSGINIQANQTSRHPPSDSQPSARQHQNETSEKINMHAFRESINGPIYKMIHELSKAMNEHLTNTSNAMAMVNQRLSAQEIHQGNMPNALKSLMEETNKTQMNKLEEIFKKQYSSLDALVVGLDERANEVRTSQVRLEDQIQDLQVKHAQQEAASSSWRATIEQSIEFLAKQIPKKTTQIPPTSLMSGTHTVTPTSAPATAQQTSQTTPNASWPNQGSNPGTPRDKKRQRSEGPGGRDFDDPQVESMDGNDAESHSKRNEAHGKKYPKLKDLHIKPMFSGKEEYKGLGCDVTSWLDIFEDAIAAEEAFSGIKWTDEQMFPGLLQNLTGSAKSFAQDSKKQAPTRSYQIMAARLKQHYQSHLTPLEYIAKMQEPKDVSKTWMEHLTYLHHVQRQVGLSNEFVLDCLACHALPSQRKSLLTAIDPKFKDDVSEQHKLIGILTRTLGTGARNEKTDKPKNQGTAAHASGKPKDQTKSKAANKSSRTTNDKKPVEPTRPCKSAKMAGQEVMAKKKNPVAPGTANIAFAIDVEEMHTTTDDEIDDFDGMAAAYFALEVKNDTSQREDINLVEANLCSADCKTVDWIADSGCTHHLTKNRDILYNATPSTLVINTAGKTKLEAHSKGSAILHLQNRNTLKLKEVHFVPALQSNLLSVSSLNSNGIDVHFGKKVDFIQRLSGYTFAMGQHKNRLPILSSNTQIERSGVANHTDVKLAERLGPDEMHIKRTPNDIAADCIDCKRGKQRRNAQPKADTGESAPIDEIGAVICADLLGPITPMDRNKNKYVAVYVDHATKMKHAVPIRHKSDQAEEFIAFKEFIEKQYDCRVKVLRSDGGGEYLSAKMHDYLRANGIRRQTTERNTSASNGLAENAIRTIFGDARTYLLSCDLPLSFWGYAVRHSVYVRNRLPTKGNPDWKSPIEMATGKPPKVNHILPFGANCTNDEVKGYNVWLPQQRKVIITRDIQAIAAPTPRQDIADFLVQQDTTRSLLSEHQILDSNPGPKSGDQVVTRGRARQMAEPEISTSLARAMIMQEINEARVFLTITEPRNAKEALSGPQAKHWQESMQAELDGLVANGTWEVVERPPSGNVVSHKWVYKIKYDREGQIDKFKARLVARGFTQRYGVEFSKTFAPVIKQASVRVIFALAATLKRTVRHLDFPQAYLKAETDYPILFELPTSSGVDTTTIVGRLLNGLYGLKQSGMLWHEEADKTLLEIGLIRSQLDPCVYYKRSEEGLTMCGLYVDDILAFSQDERFLQGLLNQLEAKHQVNDLGSAKRVLGMNVLQVGGDYFLDQSHMIQDLLTKHGLADAKPQKTPLAVDHGFFEEWPRR